MLWRGALCYVSGLISGLAADSVHCPQVCSGAPYQRLLLGPDEFNAICW